MSDIIKDAKQLLEDVTPGKWRAADSDIIAEDGNRFIATVSEYSGLDELSEECANVQLIASAPELAQALAEETLEYSFQVKYADGWETACDDVSHVDKWWPDKSAAEWAANSAYDPYIDRPMRLVRRRVSEPEVISE